MDPPIDIAAMRTRYPRAFGAAPLTRALRWLGGLLFVAWLVALCAWFDITPDRLSRGHRRGLRVAYMLTLLVDVGGFALSLIVGWSFWMHWIDRSAVLIRFWVYGY